MKNNINQMKIKYVEKQKVSTNQNYQTSMKQTQSNPVQKGFKKFVKKVDQHQIKQPLNTSFTSDISSQDFQSQSIVIKKLDLKPKQWFLLGLSKIIPINKNELQNRKYLGKLQINIRTNQVKGPQQSVLRFIDRVQNEIKMMKIKILTLHNDIESQNIYNQMNKQWRFSIYTVNEIQQILKSLQAIYKVQSQMSMNIIMDINKMSKQTRYILVLKQAYQQVRSIISRIDKQVQQRQYKSVNNENTSFSYLNEVQMINKKKQQIKRQQSKRQQSKKSQIKIQQSKNNQKQTTMMNKNRNKQYKQIKNNNYKQKQQKQVKNNNKLDNKNNINFNKNNNKNARWQYNMDQDLCGQQFDIQSEISAIQKHDGQSQFFNQQTKQNLELKYLIGQNNKRLQQSQNIKNILNGQNIGQDRRILFNKSYPTQYIFRQHLIYFLSNSGIFNVKQDIFIEQYRNEQDITYYNIVIKGQLNNNKQQAILKKQQQKIKKINLYFKFEKVLILNHYEQQVRKKIIDRFGDRDEQWIKIEYKQIYTKQQQPLQRKLLFLSKKQDYCPEIRHNKHISYILLLKGILTQWKQIQKQIQEYAQQINSNQRIINIQLTYNKIQQFIQTNKDNKIYKLIKQTIEQFINLHNDKYKLININYMQGKVQLNIYVYKVSINQLQRVKQYIIQKLQSLIDCFYINQNHYNKAKHIIDNLKSRYLLLTSINHNNKGITLIQKSSSIKSSIFQIFNQIIQHINKPIIKINHYTLINKHKRTHKKYILK